MNKYSEEIKQKIKVISEEPGKVFGFVYPYVLTIIIILGFYYVLHLNDSARQKVNPALPDSTLQKELSVMQARIIPPVDLATIGESTPELVNRGMTLFKANCASCHGEEGKGNGPASAGLNPPPRNFTSIAGWKNGAKLSQIFTTLQEGIPGSAMVAFDLLTPEEKFSIAHYIRSTFVTNPPKDAPEDLSSLDQLYNLSKGKEISAQIPVSSAEKIMVNENDTNIQKITRVIGTFSENNNEDGLAIFTRITKNKFKAITSLYHSNAWKGNEKNLMNFLSLNVNQNGFNGEVFNLRKDELSKLYNFVSTGL